LLRASLAHVGPRYALEKEGGFKRGDQRGVLSRLQGWPPALFGAD